MHTFLIVMTCVVWLMGIFAAIPAVLHSLDSDYRDTNVPLAIVIMTLAMLWIAGGITWGIEGGLFDDTFPEDGCYRITTNTHTALIGKVVAVVQDKSFERITCS